MHDQFWLERGADPEDDGGADALLYKSEELGSEVTLILEGGQLQMEDGAGVLLSIVLPDELYLGIWLLVQKYQAEQAYVPGDDDPVQMGDYEPAF